MNPNADQLWRHPRWTLALLLASAGFFGVGFFAWQWVKGRAP